MGAAKKLLEKKVLRNLVPLNALSAIHLEEISKKAVIEEVRSGRYVFRKGDRDYHSVYLIEGKVELLENGREVVGTVQAGSDAAQHPLAHKQPRQQSARAAGNVTVARIDSSLLDVLLTWDESSGYDVVEIDAEENEDWMTRMLQSQAFLQLPPSNIHQLLMRLEEVSLDAGDTVVQQGDEGDYFYIVKTGRLAVSRKPSPRGKEVLLAELGEGACFGEEALVSEATRNASVTMLTDGTLMRLSKEDFKQLLCVPMVHEVRFAEAQELVSQGAQWLDVRLPGEFQNHSISDSINLPLSALRDQSAELDSDIAYIVCCDTGRRSAAGAFLLRQRGFNVYTLKNGLMDVPEDVVRGQGGVSSGAEQGKDAEIIPFGAEGKGDIQGTRGHKRGAGASSSPSAEQLPDSDHAAVAVLQEQLEQAGEQLEAMQLRLQEAEAQRAEEEAISARVIEQIDAVEGDLRRALKERSEFEQQLRRLQADSQSSGAELEQVTGHLERERGEHEKRVRLLEQELAQIRDDYKQLGQRAGVLAGERDTVVGELDKARRELAAAQEKLDTQQQEASSRTEAVTRELEVRARELQTEKDRHQILEQKLAELAEERKQQNQALTEAQQREQGLQQQLQEAEQRAQAALETARGDASAAEQALQERIVHLESELESRQGQLQGEQSQREELADKLGAAEQALTEAQQREQSLQQQLQEAQRGTDGYEQELKRASQTAEELTLQIDEMRRKDVESARQVAGLEKQLAEQAKDFKSEIAGVRDALARAQDERENVKRDQKRLMESLRKAERKLEAERHDHEAEVHRLRKELKQTAGESNQGLAAELEALQKQLKQDRSDREELEIKLGERSAQLEDVQAQMERLTKQLSQAQDSARQAEQQLLEATQAANEEMTIRLNAEQETQMALRLELENAGRELDGHRAELSQLAQEAVELRNALQATQARLTDHEQAQQLVVELRHQLQQAERDRDTARAAEQSLRQEAGQLRTAAEVSRRLASVAPEDDPQQVLREELEQAQRNAELAVNERDQSEARLRNLQRELDDLRAQLGEMRQEQMLPVAPAAIRALDADDADAGSMLYSSLNESAAGENPLTAETVFPESDRAMPASPHAASRARLGPGKGLLASALLLAFTAVGTAWWFVWKPSPVGQDGASSSVSSEHRTADEQTESTRTAVTVDESGGAASPVTLPAFVRGGADLAELHSASGEASVREDATEPVDAVSTANEAGQADGEAADSGVVAPAVVRQPGAEFRDRLRSGGSGPSMVELYADSFQMGSGSASPNFDERPRHDVALKRFALSKHEITFDQYDRFAESTGRARPRSGGRGRGSRPVVNVSWADAVAYTDWLSAQTGHRYRLPTEAEWEFAARSGTITRYWWGNKVGQAHANCFDCGTESSGRETVPAGSFPASPFGLHDLAGNAREWVKDCYEPNYQNAPGDGSAVESANCPQRVIRGGSYASPSTKLRVTARDQAEPGTRLDDLGFRVAREY